MTHRELKQAMLNLDVCVPVAGCEEWVFTSQAEVIRLNGMVEMVPVRKQAGILYLAPKEES